MGTNDTNDTNSSSDGNSTSTNQTVEPRTQTFTTKRDGWFIQERGRYKYNFTNSWMYATAIMGGHAIGGANFTRSGYWGNFTGNVTSSGAYDTGTRTFDNQYFR